MNLFGLDKESVIEVIAIWLIVRTFSESSVGEMGSLPAALST